MTYPAFGKIPRWNREVVLTEKIDGTNGLVAVRKAGDGWPEGRTRPPRSVVFTDGTEVAAGSRKRWLTPESDNFGFAQWVWDNAEALAQLGSGNHYGEWYGKGIQRNYGLTERRFMLFNVAKWGDDSDNVRPKVCEVATVLARCAADDLPDVLSANLATMEMFGSAHVPGFKRPEGIVLYHTAGNHLYKVTLEGDRAKTPDGYVVQPAESKWLGLGKDGLRDLVTSPIDPKEVTRNVLQQWTNKEIGTDQFETEVVEPDERFTITATAKGEVREKVAA